MYSNIFLSLKKGCAYNLFAQEYFKTFNIQIDKRWNLQVMKLY